MAKMGKSMSVASRLAAATALTGTLAACDGRFGRAADELFSPMSAESPAQPVQRIAVPPAAPGNPVYVGGSRAANNALYQQTYGAPIEGSGQALAVPAQPSYGTSVYQDSAIAAQPVNVLPAYDAGASINSDINTGGYSTPISAPQYDTGTQYNTGTQYSTGATSFDTPLPNQGQYIQAPQPAYSTPQPAYNAPGSSSFPAIGSQPIYSPQSALPQSDMYTNASADSGLRDIEPLLDFSPRSEPYGSSASVRYSVAEEELPTVDTTSRYAVSTPVLQADPSYTPTALPLETVEVASLDGYAPMPRARPTRVDAVAKPSPVLTVAAVPAPLPTVRPELLRAPLPTRRPVQLASLSGQAITDAPALTAPPVMIEVEPIFLDDEPMAKAAPMVETAALAPLSAPSQDEPVTDAPELVVIKPDDLKAEMAALDTSKIDTSLTKNLIVADNSASTVPSAAAGSEDLTGLKELSGTSWRLASLNGEDVSAEAELHFDGTSGFAGGQGICNNYGGEFKESLKGEFGMANIFTTETKCPDLAVEKRYIVALETASKYRMAPGLKELLLLGPNGKTLATFVAF